MSACGAGCAAKHWLECLMVPPCPFPQNDQVHLIIITGWLKNSGVM